MDMLPNAKLNMTDYRLNSTSIGSLVIEKKITNKVDLQLEAENDNLLVSTTSALICFFLLLIKLTELS